MPAIPIRRAAVFLLLFGLYLTLRGYHSFEGDQAYRLPILKHGQDLRLYSHDPFVRSFDGFNPHRGYLTLLDGFSRSWGLATAIFLLYALTCALTAAGVDRLARAVWPNVGAGVGVATLGLFLLAQAGNIGTNHLFEPILYERLLGFGLGWVAIAFLIVNPARGGVPAACALALASLVHPSVGLQLALSLGAACVVWDVLGWTGDARRGTLIGVGFLLVTAALPGAWFNLRNSHLLTEGLSIERILLLSAELQSPQHMLPHLWRRPQWAAWGCYPLLAIVTLVSARHDLDLPTKTWLELPTTAWSHESAPRDLSLPAKRLAALLAVLLGALGCAGFAIEVLGNARIILFQPFRMATVARGLCLVFIAGHGMRLWERASHLDILRCVLLAVGLIGDRLWVVIALFETVMTCADLLRDAHSRLVKFFHSLGFGLLFAGAVFLALHDTEFGHVPLIAATTCSLVLGRSFRRFLMSVDDRRLALRLMLAWTLPAMALGANLVSDSGIPSRARPLRRVLVKHCRFLEVPTDDVEYLALWCRAHTPIDAVFIGPPGVKSFRLWSRRSVAFNRAGSPYVATGLDDWARRFADHVGLADQPPEALVAAHLHDRKNLESRYDEWHARELAALARRQGADFVLAGRDVKLDPHCGLVMVRREGKYAVYRVEPTGKASAGTG